MIPSVFFPNFSLTVLPKITNPCPTGATRALKKPMTSGTTTCAALVDESLFELDEKTPVLNAATFMSVDLLWVMDRLLG
jgi:hypothetical protein